MGVHESQSRLWEKLVGRSRPFWQHVCPILSQRFPSQLNGITFEQFYRGVNQVQQSDAHRGNEVGQNLHVMLRV